MADAPSARTRRPRNSLSAPAVLDAAERVASDGLDRLTIRAVADELGSSPMSLYRYIASREELVEALLNRVLERMEAAAPTADPLADLRGFARRHLELLLAHAWAVPGLIAHPAPGPNAVPIGEQALEILYRLGARGDHAVALFSGIVALNYGWASFAIARRAAEAQPSLDRIAGEPDARFPRTAAVAVAMLRFGAEEHYDLVLGDLLAGIAANRVG
ncbi:TetR/AcrR family transcriptional regulator [Microbacterium sp. BWT-B31]|uniref:TetR/AcrR family transcriptional regulator n=1 Tax=Microbacterium sp. BWT-B31 TaxID=3232072 RepID=UPI003528632F